MGIFSKSIDIEKSIELNNAGYASSDNGEIEDAIDMWSQASQLGQPNALASLMWSYSLLNRPGDAISAYESNSSRVEAWFDALSKKVGDRDQVAAMFGEQLVNIRGNLALALWLRDDTTKQTIEELAHGMKLGNLESTFLITQVIDGTKERFNLSPKKLKHLRGIYSKVISKVSTIEAKNPNLVRSDSRISFKDAAITFIESIDASIATYDPYANQVNNDSTEGADYDLPDIDPWLRKNATLLHELEILTSGENIIRANSLFNVEVAEIFISNFYPEVCNNCNDSESCTQCGRGGKDFITCMSANRDSDYLLCDIRGSNLESPLQGTFLSFFQNYEDWEFRMDGGLDFFLPPVAPVVIGEISMGQSGDIFFGDKLATVNSDDFVSILHVEGDQTVIAWIGYDGNGNSPTPLAITTTNKALTEVIRSEVTIESNVPKLIRDCVVDSLDGSVFARMGRDLEAVAAENLALAEGEWDQLIRESWMNQVLAQQDFERLAQETLENAREHLSGALIVIHCLRKRGQVEASSKLYSLVKAEFSNELNSNQLAFIEISESTKPGISLPEGTWEHLLV